ncbi:MAG TPA: hypothetical protein VMX16_06540 [Terriglobia bacterium]|nr:hypothetical protein [Terriglobia bacterium]
MEILTLLMLLAKSVLMPFQEQSERLAGFEATESTYPQPGIEKPIAKRHRRRGPSHNFRPGYHCPQPAT